MGRLGLGVLLALGVACGGSAARNGATAGGSAGAITGGAGTGGGGAGQGGVMASGGGGSGGMWICGGNSVVEHPEGTIADSSGFSGTIDGTPVELRASAPDSFSSEPGAINAVAASCLGGVAFELYLYFDAPFAGESLEISAARGDACQITGRYSLGPDTLVPLGATLELKLDVWAQNQGDGPPTLFNGSFTADVRSMDGIPVRMIKGEFAVQAGRQICI